MCLFWLVAIGLGLSSRRLLSPHSHVQEYQSSALMPVSFQSELIAFEAIIDNSYEIFIRDDRTGQTQQLTTHFGNDRFPVLSPLNDQVAFVSWRDGNSEIYVVDLATSRLRNLSNHNGRDGLPTWSPDGNLLAYVSKRNNQYDILVADVNRGLIQNLTRSLDHESQPAWLALGQGVAFSSYRDGAQQHRIINLSGQEVEGNFARKEWQTAQNTSNIDIIGGEVSG